MRVLIAPDSFKGSLTARAAASAIASGWRSERPNDAIELVPMADGGEGTLDALEAAFPEARRVPVIVSGPEGKCVVAEWLEIPGTEQCVGAVGVVELASCSGLTLSEGTRPLDAHTFGFGQAIAGALDRGVSRLVLALGGSASTDGGAGALEALGARFLDSEGSPVARGNRGLSAIATVETDRLRTLPEEGAAVICDVSNPLFGALGAAHVFGAQKGADPSQTDRMDAALRHFSQILSESMPGADPESPGTGAAGGTGFGLARWGADLIPGAELLGDLLGLPERVERAEMVITGEGRFDDQSAFGKLPSYVAGLARCSGTPVALVAGRIDAPASGFAAEVELCRLAGSEDAAVGRAHLYLTLAGAELARIVGRDTTDRLVGL